jgi:hypothetical protein
MVTWDTPVVLAGTLHAVSEPVAGHGSTRGRKASARWVRWRAIP